MERGSARVGARVSNFEFATARCHHDCLEPRRRKCSVSYWAISHHSTSAIEPDGVDRGVRLSRSSTEVRSRCSVARTYEPPMRISVDDLAGLTTIKLYSSVRIPFILVCPLTVHLYSYRPGSSIVNSTSFDSRELNST